MSILFFLKPHYGRFPVDDVPGGGLDDDDDKKERKKKRRKRRLERNRRELEELALIQWILDDE